jgi:hypothetical protein
LLPAPELQEPQERALQEQGLLVQQDPELVPQSHQLRESCAGN